MSSQAFLDPSPSSLSEASRLQSKFFPFLSLCHPSLPFHPTSIRTGYIVFRVCGKGRWRGPLFKRINSFKIEQTIKQVPGPDGHGVPRDHTGAPVCSGGADCPSLCSGSGSPGSLVRLLLLPGSPAWWSPQHLLGPAV